MRLSEFLESNGVHVESPGHRHVRTGWIGVDCPFCSGGHSSHKFHLGFNTQTRAVNCWICGRHTLIDALVALTRLSEIDVRRALPSIKFQKLKEVDRPRGKLKIPKGTGRMQPVHRKYLSGRGFSPRKLEKVWDLQGIGIHPRMPWSIFIPIHFNGEVVSWTTRTVGTGDGGPRFISASPEEEAMHHKDLLYGEDYCRYAIIIHEGPADVWATGPGAAALFGAYPTHAQFARIIKYPKRIICLDATADGRKNGRRLCDELGVFPGETVLVELETGKDSGEAGHREVRELRKLLD